MLRRLVVISAVTLAGACAPKVTVLPMPTATSLTTVAELRRTVDDPRKVWLLINHRFGRSALYLDSLPAGEVIAVVGRDSVTPIWGPTRLAISIERCGLEDTVLTLRGKRVIRRSAPCPWAPTPESAGVRDRAR